MEKFYCRQKLAKTLSSYFYQLDREITDQISLFSANVTVHFLSEEAITGKENIKKISLSVINSLVRLVTGTAEIAAQKAVASIPDSANGQNPSELLAAVQNWPQLFQEAEETFFKSQAGQDLAKEIYEVHPALIGPIKKLSYIVYKMYEEEMQLEKINCYFHDNY